jgi:hypothetical protein
MAEVDFDRNVTSLYDAIVKSDWDQASRACRRSPIEAETWVVRRDHERGEGPDGDGDILWRFLPLHSACARRPPLSFVIDLLNAYPDAARAKDESGMYPIHYACGNRASKSVIKELVECFPRALQEADPQGMLPLHYIAQWGPSEDGVVELLMDVCAESALALNSEGMSPLNLCREAKYDDRGKVFAVMEKKVTDLRRFGKRMELGVPREIEARQEDPSPTTAVRRGTKPPRSPSVPRMERSLSQSRMPLRGGSPETGARKERSLSRVSSRGRSREIDRSREIKVYDEDSSDSSKELSRRFRKKRSSSPSRRSSLRVHSEWAPASTKYDERHEVSTPRARNNESRATPKSLQSLRANLSALSIENLAHSNPCESRLGIASSLVSPRYCEMITPRSSGRGVSSHASPRTPRSSGHGVSFVSGLHTPRSTRSVVFDFTNDQIPRSHDMNLVQPPPPSPSLVHNHLLDKEKMAQLQVVNRVSQENMDEQYHVYLAKENMELRAKLVDYEIMRAENTQLRAKLAKMQEVQVELSGIVEMFGGLTRM